MFVGIDVEKEDKTIYLETKDRNSFSIGKMSKTIILTIKETKTNYEILY